ncbi:oxygenase MpaB family protein [Glaciihabitans arcticus]|uniref:oxygenase MpaB family protein n=1 Tax=Glaciihabitans arcticus TaxID=2668039 RepID=UPI0013866F61|nr:oxygenase MpaB family protein [Glaciihabitans arcticus]
MRRDPVETFARNGALIAGGARAILLQVADPVVGAGVAQHSDFAHRPLDRLRNTLTFVYAVVLGTPDEATRVAGYVDRAHQGIPGATDPPHQLWVAATLYDSAIVVHEKLYGPVDTDGTDSLADAILARYAPLATSLQVPLADWPASRAEFDPWFAKLATELEVSDDARQVARDLFHPVVAPPWLRAGLPFVALLTASLLGPDLRAAFALPWSPARERRASVAWAVARVAVRLAPRILREWPSRHYLRRLRAR